MAEASMDVPFVALKPMTRIVAALTLGIAPILVLITLGSDYAKTAAPLELAVSLEVLNLVITALLLGTLGGRILHERLLLMLSLGIAGCLTLVWLHHWHTQVNIVGFMVIVHFGYLLRMRALFSRTKAAAQSAKFQFKVDTSIIICASAYYILFNQIAHYFPIAEQQMLFLSIAAVAMWAYLLWSIERAELGYLKQSVTSMWFMMTIAVASVIVGIPVLGMLLLLLMGGIGAILVPLSSLMPHFSIKWGQWMQTNQNLIKVNPGKPRGATHYLFTASVAHDLTVGICTVAAIVAIWLVLRRKQHDGDSERQSPSSSLVVAERIRMTAQTELRFLPTDSKVRAHVQAWLRDRASHKHTIEPWQTIRDFATSDHSSSEDIKALVRQYEAVRYDPNQPL